MIDYSISICLSSIFYLLAIGLSSLWSEWACLDSSEMDEHGRQRSQRVRYKSCTNPSEYDGGAYCGNDQDIREIDVSTKATDATEADETAAYYPLCYSGAWVCSKVRGDKAGTLGDGSTQGTCEKGKTCFTSPTDSSGCRGMQ